MNEMKILDGIRRGIENHSDVHILLEGMEWVLQLTVRQPKVKTKHTLILDYRKKEWGKTT